MSQNKTKEITDAIIDAIFSTNNIDNVDIDGADRKSMMNSDGSCSFEMIKYHNVKVLDNCKIKHHNFRPVGETIYTVTITSKYIKYDEDDE